MDELVIQELVDASEVTLNETVLEIGPGTGNITAALLEKAGKVLTIEKNPKYRSVLNGRFGNDPKLVVEIGDVLYYRFPNHNRIVSNLPYMISEPIFHRLFKLDFISASFIVSKGFAEKISPTDTPETKLGFLSQLFFETAIISEIRPDAYLPPPGTQTVIITVKHKEPTNTRDKILQALFRQEDKKTSNALREALIQTGIAETKRLAKQAASSLEVPQPILDAPVGRLSLDQILELVFLFPD